MYTADDLTMDVHTVYRLLKGLSITFSNLNGPNIFQCAQGHNQP